MAWITAPLSLVHSAFQSNSDDWETQITKQFQEKISDHRTQIPELSCDSKSGTLVRHIFMVQDILDQEFYVKKFLARDKNGNEMMGTGKYSDTLDLPQGYEVEWDETQHIRRDSRLVYYGVPVPGRSAWTHEPSRDVMGESREVTLHRVEVQGGKKRAAPEEEEEMDTTDDGTKKQKSKEEEEDEKNEKQQPPKFLGLNKVLPCDKGPCCMILVYCSEETAFKINDVVEVVGIVERLQIPEDCEMDEENAARFPPSSMVPRLHCLDIRKRSHMNPTLEFPLQIEGMQVQGILQEAATVRQELISVLKECVLGDPLAAEYLLLHLLSHIYGRRDDVLALGKFAVNVTHCPKNPMFVRCLATVIGNVCEKSFLFPMTVSNFNNSSMLPQKDYKANRLRSGLLQLPFGSQIILDETVLEPGQLKANGVENLKSLGNLISWQKLTYDFGFNYIIEFECDARVLILGEGKSLLPSDVVVPLKPMSDCPDYDQIMSSLSTSKFLEKFRKYLSVVRHIEYKEVSEQMQNKIEQDFVEERKKDPKNVTGDTLHRLLVISRLCGLSRGHLVLQEEDWQAAKNLERDRITRLQ